MKRETGIQVAAVVIFILILAYSLWRGLSPVDMAAYEFVLWIGYQILKD